MSLRSLRRTGGLPSHAARHLLTRLGLKLPQLPDLSLRPITSALDAIGRSWRTQGDRTQGIRSQYPAKAVLHLSKRKVKLLLKIASGRPSMGIFNTFKDGDLVPASGVYAALHSTPHRLVERVLYIEGDRFR